MRRRFKVYKPFAIILIIVLILFIFVKKENILIGVVINKNNPMTHFDKLLKMNGYEYYLYFHGHGVKGYGFDRDKRIGVALNLLLPIYSLKYDNKSEYVLIEYHDYHEVYSKNKEPILKNSTVTAVYFGDKGIKEAITDKNDINILLESKNLKGEACPGEMLSSPRFVNMYAAYDNCPIAAIQLGRIAYFEEKWIYVSEEFGFNHGLYDINTTEDENINVIIINDDYMIQELKRITRWVPGL